MKSIRWVLTGLVAVTALGANGAWAADDASRARHALERFGYGPTPGAIASVSAMGVDRWIAGQLTPATIAEDPALATRLAALKTLSMSPDALYHAYFPGKNAKKDPAARARRRVPVAEAAEARLLRAVESPRQLEAVLTEFWFNHFNVYAGKGPVGVWVGAYEAQAIRPHVLGRFRDMLGAVAHHPAMLFYLDNWRNTAVGAAAPRKAGRKGPSKKPPKRPAGLNENYGRELLELHTLGVDGGYTQADVVTLARVLTGWGFEKPGQHGNYRFAFHPARHDGETKVLLGQPLTASGEAEVEQALDRLAAHPATARHLALELARFFVADDPPAGLVDRLAARYSATQGDLRAVMATLASSPEFWDAKARGVKFKSPYRYVVSSLRAVGARPESVEPAEAAIKAAGMPLFGCLTPDGYKATEGAWLSPQAMALRVGFATQLGSNRAAWAHLEAAPDAERLASTLAFTPSPRTREAIAASGPALRAALLLGSPEFNRY